MNYKLTFLTIVVLVLELCQSQDSKPQTPLEYRQAGDKALNENKYEEAISLYSSAINLDSEDYTNFYKRAAVYLIRGKNNLALSDLNIVLNKKPDFLQARIRRGKVLVQLGRFDGAKKDFEVVLKEKPDNDIAASQMAIIRDAETRLNNGKQLAQQKQYQQAIAEFTAFIDKVADHIEARLERAACHLELREFHQVIEDTMRVLKQKSDNLDALYLRGRAFHFLGQTEAAINHLKEALRQDPDNAKCKNEFKRLKRLTQALQDGEQYLNARRFPEAVAEYITAAELDADNPFALPNIYTAQCNAYVQLRKGQDALDACNKALSFEDGKIDALLYRAEAHILLENLDGAQSDFQNVANREPNNHKAREGMQRVQRLIKIASRKNYYQILGVTKEASPADIRKAYRQLALEFHPDKHQDRAVADKMIVEINEAYEVLSDEEKRRRYDNGEDLEDQHHGHGFPGGFPFHQQGGPFNFHFQWG